MRRLIAAVLLFCLPLLACVPATKDYTKFNTAEVRSILVVPVVNRSVDVTAPDYLLSTLTIPLAEHGYYVFPVNMVKRLLEDDGLSDADFVHRAPAERLGSLFGADAILYVQIDQWDAKWVLLSTQVTVSLSYLLHDARTGEELWRHQQQMTYVPQNNSTGNPIADLIAMAVTAAVTKAAPNYMPLAHQANERTFAYPGPGFPPGPYYVPPQTVSRTSPYPE